MTSGVDPLESASDPASSVPPLDVLPEGAEAAPRGARTMGIVRWAIVLLMAFVAGAAWVYTGHDTGGSAHARSFHCPMHPTVLADAAGSCPVCGMDLVPVGKAPPPSASGIYWCPMHPEVTSRDPEARCEKCGGMKLLPKPAEAAAPGERVPGLAPLDLTEERARLAGMRTAKVVRAALARELRTVGFVAPNERRLETVTARIAGWVQDLEAVQTKPYVRKDEVLARLFNPDVRQRQQGYISAARFGAAQSAPSGGPEARSILEEAHEQLRLIGFAEVDLAEIARTLQPMRLLPIRAPISGHVVKSVALPGSYVEAGAPLFQVADLSTVWVIAEVYEPDVGHVRVGQAGRLVVEAWPSEVFTGRVRYVHPTVNPSTRTMQVRLEVPNRGLKLRPGMHGDAFLELASRPSLIAPVDAVADTGDVQYVILAGAGGRLEPRRVKVGARSEAGVEILSGLAEGDSVVTAANFLIDSESRVRAALEDLAAESAPAPSSVAGH